MNEQRMENLNEARRKARRRRRRRLMIIRTAIVLGIVALLVIVGWFVVWKFRADAASARKETTTFFPVKEIVVEGETRYSAEELIEKSGLYVGQSLMGVNKVQAHDLLEQNFPYLDTIEVSNASFDVLRIRVTDTAVMGAAQVGDAWYIVGVNNKTLEKVAADAVPTNLLRIVGATTENVVIGEGLMDQRSLQICETVTSAAALYELHGMTTIDITVKTKLAISLNDRIQVVLGNETNIPAQIKMLTDTLPVLYKNNGLEAAGRLDMTTYADDNPNNDKAVFTPAELLQKPEENPPVDSTTATGDATATTTTTAG